MNSKTIAKLCCVLIAALLFSSAGCTSSSGKNDAKDDIKSNTVSYKAKLSPQTITPFPDAFVNGNNQYGWSVAADLYDEQNIAISPASLELALLMTRAGAIDETADEMRDALFMSGLSDDEILSACQQLMWRTNTFGAEAANSLWIQKDYPLSDNYIGICNDNFMADAYEADFVNESKLATDELNDWASDKTHGKIKKMIPEPLSPDTRLVLMNALYFLGKWENPFDANLTYDQTFYGASSDNDVSFMHSETYMNYMENDAYQMISMPFKGETDDVDSPYSMAFILPAEGQDVSDVMNQIAQEGFSVSCDQLVDTKVRLSLPKFEFTYDTSMVNTMKALGMELAFDGGSARFDGMTDSVNGLYISDILHKCFIRVDEEGAEAAAVTVVIMTETAMPIQEDIVEFNADRPFLFAIYDETDNTVLFLGAVAQL
jgi:serpin B